MQIEEQLLLKFKLIPFLLQNIQEYLENLLIYLLINYKLVL